MGGTMWVESEENLGSRFQFTANFLRDDSDAKHPLLQSDILQHKSILLWTDNVQTGCVLQETLENWGGLVTNIQQCQDADELIESIANEGFDLVIVDGKVNGGTLLDQLPQRMPVPTILLFEKNQPDFVDRFAEFTGELICKPVRLRDFHNAIHKLCGGELPTDQNATESPEVEPQALRVLLAEDVEINQQIAQGLLNHMGHSVEIANDGEEAVRALTSGKPFDVVLMDVEMPNLDGIEATQRIREWETDVGRRVPIIAMTAHAIPEIQKKCYAAGMDDYITKPIEPGKIQEKLDQWSRATSSSQQITT